METYHITKTVVIDSTANGEFEVAVVKGHERIAIKVLDRMDTALGFAYRLANIIGLTSN